MSKREFELFLVGLCVGSPAMGLVTLSRLGYKPDKDEERFSALTAEAQKEMEARFAQTAGKEATQSA